MTGPAPDPCEGLFQTERQGGRFVITRADRNVHASDKILAMAAAGELLGELVGAPAPYAGDFAGALLVITDDNGRTIAYEVVERCEHGAWRMRFPD